MNKGDATAAILQKTVYKLLRAHVPKRCSTSNEFSLRFKFLLGGKYSDFLCRIEEQTRMAHLLLCVTP